MAMAILPSSPQILIILSPNLHKSQTLIISSANKRARSSSSTPPDDSNVSSSIGGLGRALLTSIQSQPIPKKLPPKKSYSGEDAQMPRGGYGVEKEKKKAPQEPHLSGLDVLLALHKASSAKKPVSTSPRRRDRKKTMSNEDLVDDQDVRPIVIKSDWATRLQELQKLLDDLKKEEV
ncbi:hypothetical protein AMTRI_Chr09g17900 [Amborella trichopoda]|uniref:Uncharacterized protein n=1 Tax=Amborella trichopoda TaxID=13333 RepID=W1PKK7_AMBTC|nr:uncharacterized protein LOC18436513 [Amborella trichopoda]XP_020524277.1 uncharacterized protein LOC18436513 [Amborella trichopoda]ERN08269.1 hypothetical protein AMTR_s00018p00257750 [Amborella trichopoda]|eukprot:XP_006846594.1 uncharacterized protein LOC18436513 [Amborella trichopoda]